jgi:hypothetical protein
MRLRRIVAATLFLAAILVGAVVQARTAEEAERLTRLFDIVVFGSEIPGVAPAERVRKWSGSVRYKVAGTDVAQWRPAIERNAKALAALTGLTYQPIGAQESGETLVILLVPRDKMAEAGALVEKDQATLKRIVDAAQGGCYFLSYSKEDRIVYAAVVANVERPKSELERCLLEEMTQALGLPNDVPGIKDPVPGYKYLGSGLTPAGELLLRALYDPKLAAGTPRAETLAFVRKLFLQ